MLRTLAVRDEWFTDQISRITSKDGSRETLVAISPHIAAVKKFANDT